MRLHDVDDSVLARSAALVSVIVPTFNRLPLLRELLESLRSQSWRPLEAIIVDDGSTESAVADLADLWNSESGLDLRILHQSNRGPAAARNLGLAAARGDFLYFIDSDDLVEPGGLALMAEALERSGAPYCVAQVRSIGTDGEPLPNNDGNVSHIDQDSIVQSRWAIHAALYRRSALANAGPFNEALRIGEDCELRWRIVASNKPGLVLHSIVAVFRRHSSGQITDRVSPEQMGAGMVHIVDAFSRWAEPRGILTPQMAKGAAVLLAIAAVRLGSAGAWEAKRAATDLACRLDGKTPSFAIRLLGLKLLESRLIFRGLEYGSRAARLAVHMARNRALVRLDRRECTHPTASEGE